MTDDERDAIQDAISDEAHDARLDRKAWFMLMGRAYCSFCHLLLDEDNPDPPRTCSGDCDARRCTTCDGRLWSEHEADEGQCEDCYCDAHPQHVTERDREAWRRGWLP